MVGVGVRQEPEFLREAEAVVQVFWRDKVLGDLDTAVEVLDLVGGPGGDEDGVPYTGRWCSPAPRTPCTAGSGGPRLGTSSGRESGRGAAQSPPHAPCPPVNDKKHNGKTSPTCVYVLCVLFNLPIVS